MSETRLPTRAALPEPGADVHFVGVAGAGMRGLATLMVREWRVSGCDREAAPAPDLEEAGVHVLGGHDPAHVRNAALLVRTSAVQENHPEVAAARAAGVPVLRRARALGALVNGTVVVGVAGTHGKSTITAMTALALEAAGLDPDAVVGAAVAAWGGFARAGSGRVTVVEADEYDRSFMELDPHLAVVSSVEPEHLESYGGSEAALARAFEEFAARAAPRLGVLTCADDPGARRLVERVPAVHTYGVGEGAAFRVEPEARPGWWRLRGPGIPAPGLTFALGVFGEHNVRNAAGALAAALRLGAEPRRLEEALAGFSGVGRRLEVLADTAGVAVIDDYAHHPSEVAAGIAALRARFPGRRVVVVFQPHLYTRTLALAERFAAALAAADESHVLPIYPAREAPIPGVSSDLILRAAGAKARAAEEDGIPALVEAALTGRTVLAFMGAGDVTRLARHAARAVETHALGG